MKNTIGANIARMRRDHKMTQETLADLLHVSFQAVSKWETGQTLPDVPTLAQIAAIMHTSLDALTGYPQHAQPNTPYQQWYQSDAYYWGVEPSSLCLQLLKLLPPTRPLRVLDIACGEGKDSVFLARCGYDVTAFDLSDAGIEKALRLADKAGVRITAFVADINEYRLSQPYDILYSSGALHYIRPELRAEIFENYKRFTNPNGLHAMNVFVQKPFIAPPPEQEICYDWHTGELFTQYSDWYMEHCTETVFDCDSSGVPHQHAMDVMIARKV